MGREVTPAPRHPRVGEDSCAPHSIGGVVLQWLITDDDVTVRKTRCELGVEICFHGAIDDDVREGLGNNVGGGDSVQDALHGQSDCCCRSSAASRARTRGSTSSWNLVISSMSGQPMKRNWVMPASRNSNRASVTSSGEPTMAMAGAPRKGTAPDQSVSVSQASRSAASW